MSGSAVRAAATLGAAALCAFGAGTASAAAPSAGRMYFYDVEIGVTGTGTLDGSYDAPPGSARPRDVIDEHYKATYSIDARLKDLVLVSGTLKGYRNRQSVGGIPAVVNGTWTTRGTMWIDPNAGLTGPYTCSGRVATTTPDPTSVLGFTRRATRFDFGVEVLADSLVSNARCDVSGVRGGLEHANANAYQTTFTVPRSQVGRKRITKTISGPDQRLQWRQYPCADCTFTLAWQGSVRFTLKRTIVVPRMPR